MAIVYSQQYRPLTTGGAAAVSETDNGAGLSTRAYRDHRTNIGNLYGRALPRNVVMNVWRTGAGLTLDVAGDAVVRPAQWVVPAWQGFATIQFKLFAWLSHAGQASKVRLYSDGQAYRTAFSSDAAYGEVTVNSTTKAWYEGEVAIVRNGSILPPLTHLTLYVDNVGAGFTTSIQVLGAWLKPLADE